MHAAFRACCFRALMVPFDGEEPPRAPAALTVTRVHSRISITCCPRKSFSIQSHPIDNARAASTSTAASMMHTIKRLLYKSTGFNARQNCNVAVQHPNSSCLMALSILGRHEHYQHRLLSLAYFDTKPIQGAFQRLCFPYFPVTEL